MRISAAAALLMAGALFMAAPAAASPVGCGALGGVVDDGICHVSETQPSYVMDLKFPLDYPDEQALIDYLAQNREGFVKVAQPGSRNLPYEMDVTAESFRSAQTRSVVLKLF